MLDLLNWIRKNMEVLDPINIFWILIVDIKELFTLEFVKTFWITESIVLNGFYDHKFKFYDSRTLGNRENVGWND